MPSLALIGIAVPFTVLIDPQLGFKVLPTLIAIVALAIPPILVNTHTGVSEVDGDLTEAARGMGLTGPQVLSGLEVPLALAVIIAGIGSAAVQIIATVTLGAIFGFGGLGAYLTEGISQGNDGMTFGGVVLVALAGPGRRGAVHAARPPVASARRGPGGRRGHVAPSAYRSGPGTSGCYVWVYGRDSPARRA